MINLRDYQLLGKEMIYGNIQKGILNNILWAQTGSGKSVIISSIIADVVASGSYCVVAVKRRELIKQMSGHMDKWRIPHGVHMANHHRFKPNEKIQICSIDTLDARSLYPHADKKRVVVVIDESHDATPRARRYARFMENYAGNPIIGFTATPFSDNSLWNGIVKPIEAHELRDQGFLVPERTFVPNVIDVSNVTISRGKFNESELFEASSKKEIVGDFVRDWKLYAQGRPTILFAVNIEHSKLICEAFNDSGVGAVHADAKTSSRERDSILKRFVNGEFRVLTNVNIFSTGLDLPEVAAIQICRPTQSLIWHLQAIGRGLRPAPHVGKQDCIIIDNAGNTIRHGTAYKIREAELGKPRRVNAVDETDIKVKRCEKCNYIYEPTESCCPNCGHENKKVVREIHQRDGDLVEYEMSDVEKAALVKKSFVNDYYKLKNVASIRLKRNDSAKEQWLREKLEEKYGLTICKQYSEIINMRF